MAACITDYKEYLSQPPSKYEEGWEGEFGPYHWFYLVSSRDVFKLPGVDLEAAEYDVVRKHADKFIPQKWKTELNHLSWPSDDSNRTTALSLAQIRNWKKHKPLTLDRALTIIVYVYEVLKQYQDENDVKWFN